MVSLDYPRGFTNSRNNRNTHDGNEYTKRLTKMKSLLQFVTLFIIKRGEPSKVAVGAIEDESCR